MREYLIEPKKKKEKKEPDEMDWDRLKGYECARKVCEGVLREKGNYLSCTSCHFKIRKHRMDMILKNME